MSDKYNRNQNEIEVNLWDIFNILWGKAWLIILIGLFCALLAFADAKEKFDKYVDFLMTETKELTKKIVNEEMVRLYETHFTHSEIKDMIAFYESP